MTVMLPPGAPEFRERFHAFRRSVFRLEALQSYAEPSEDEGFAAFLDGQPEPPDPHHDAWCEQIATAVEAGKSVQRVHVIREPLTDYARYELTWGYAPNVHAGEEVRIIPVPPGGRWIDGVPTSDFWLFDDVELYVMRYSPQGTLIGLEYVTDPLTVDVARGGRDAALRLGVPWSSYISARPDLARHLDVARAS